MFWDVSVIITNMLNHHRLFVRIAALVQSSWRLRQFSANHEVQCQATLHFAIKRSIHQHLDMRRSKCTGYTRKHQTFTTPSLQSQMKSQSHKKICNLSRSHLKQLDLRYSNTTLCGIQLCAVQQAQEVSPAECAWISTCYQDHQRQDPANWTANRTVLRDRHATNRRSIVQNVVRCFAQSIRPQNVSFLNFLSYVLSFQYF